MQYIQIDDDRFIQLDDDTNKTTVIIKSDLENELSTLTDQINALPPMPSDDELMAWARSNYQSADTRNREVLQSSIDSINGILSQLDNSSGLLMSAQKVKNVLQNP